ncbi:histidine kinase [Actinoplanes sp. TRM 88003]|uniref:histidine kinase n=1 Tax=Paractinoplanes aksuensis TaxID=2939490 RepID=A0ABT1DJP9_9ACTN|nr:histidine kinase [Actinoplanes aksuensis]MCO8270291.1 histidine kinase [Actinoplanes aksuensis]
MNANRRPERRSRVVPVLLAVGVVTAVAMVTGGARGPAATVIPALFAAGAVTAAVWAVLRWRADRRLYEHRLTEWAAAEAVHSERLKIARDLHDIVSHGLGLITVRAASTRHLDKPPEVAEALTDIEQASRGATAELRRMLTVLRESGAERATGGSWEVRQFAAPRTPVDDLSVLPAIVRAAETAGVRPELTVTELGAVSPGVQVAICQTVREALSNTARHAGPTDVRVVVRRDLQVLVVSVADDGPAPGWSHAPGAGHGLLGLHERISALGGSLAAREKGGGFQLTARIPDEVAGP